MKLLTRLQSSRSSLLRYMGINVVLDSDGSVKILAHNLDLQRLSQQQRFIPQTTNASLERLKTIYLYRCI